MGLEGLPEVGVGLFRNGMELGVKVNGEILEMAEVGRSSFANVV